MKIIFTLLIFFLSAPSYAFDKWNKEDIALQTIFTIETLIDWKQTKTCMKNGGREKNYLLGSRPNQQTIDLFMGSSILLHAGISMLLPKKYRNYWQYLWIGIEAKVIHHNYQVGTRISF